MQHAAALPTLFLTRLLERRYEMMPPRATSAKVVTQWSVNTHNGTTSSTIVGFCFFWGGLIDVFDATDER
jgi:hypothetical protein